MGVPSVMKIKKGNVEYTGKVDIAKYTIRELTRRALLDVGRYVTYNVRKNIQTIFPFTRFHRASQRYQYWVLKKENELILGVENLKKGAKTAWWADQLETNSFLRPDGGTTQGQGGIHAPRRHLLEKFVKSHVDKIVELESQYLTMINNEPAAIAFAKATEDMEVLRGDES